MLISAAGTVLVTAYAALAALQILVLNPLAAAPGIDLNQIHADMAAVGESLNAPVAVGVLGLGIGLAILLFVLIAVRRDVTRTAAMFGYLVLLAFGAPAYFIASFGAGMGLADTYMIGGADYSPWALPLYLTSLLALLAALTLGAVDLTRRHRRMTPPIAT
ncbi:hypothetical protein SAMN04487846_3445 [Microbacterium sp. cf046]|nr:hypothetical protein SAMN04487846_3445 [Microbacterium sp. cf046]